MLSRACFQCVAQGGRVPTCGSVLSPWGDISYIQGRKEERKEKRKIGVRKKKKEGINKLDKRGIERNEEMKEVRKIGNKRKLWSVHEQE